MITTVKGLSNATVNGWNISIFPLQCSTNKKEIANNVDIVQQGHVRTMIQMFSGVSGSHLIGYAHIANYIRSCSAPRSHLGIYTANFESSAAAIFASPRSCLITESSAFHIIECTL